MLSVRPEHLTNLDPEEAVGLFRQLLWAEASRVGLSRHHVNVPGRINDPDGGIDAEISVSVNPGKSLLAPGETRYQIKTGAFNLQGLAKAKEILFNNPASRRPALKERIWTCFDRKARLMIALFGWDGAESHDEAIVGKFREALKKYAPEYVDTAIEVLRQNQIIGLIEQFPGLALQVNSASGDFQTHQVWSRDPEMRHALQIGLDQEKTIAALREELRKGGSSRALSIYGEPGVGKTRLVLEATKDVDLAPLVVYADASRFPDSDLLNTILRMTPERHAILILDDCNADIRDLVYRRLSAANSEVPIVCIIPEVPRRGFRQDYLEVLSLDTSSIAQILQGYGIALEYADRWAELCGGSPRWAHIIGSSLQLNPADNLLQNPDVERVVDRVVAGRYPLQSTAARERRIVLRYLALFRKFGYGPHVRSEAQFIAKQIQVNDGLSWARFQEIVEELRTEKTLQGRETLYITPRALHLFLWTEWWGTYASSFGLPEFLNELPPGIREWFVEMFRYAEASPAASRIVASLLEPGGLLRDFDILNTAFGSRFFLALAEAKPEAAVSCLEAVLGDRSPQELMEFRDGRSSVVSALELIAVWRDTFANAARILLRLGEAENENLANNATGIFVGLFSPGPGRLAPTEVAPIERLAIVEEALESDSEERKRLALSALEASLRTSMFHRFIGPEFQGLRREPQFWIPANQEEEYAGHKRAWHLLMSVARTQGTAQGDEAARILVENATTATFIPDFAEEVIASLRELLRFHPRHEERALERIAILLRYHRKSLPPPAAALWESLQSELFGSGFSAEMRRYVAMDILEDRIDERGRTTDAMPTKHAELARRAIQQPQLLDAELPWLLKGDGVNSNLFGFQLGQEDSGFRLLHRLIDEQKMIDARGSLLFLGGYFRSLYGRDRELWETTLERMSRDEGLRAFVPELTWRSGATDNAIRRVLRLAREGHVADENFRYFGMGGFVRELSSDAFDEMIRYLLGRETTFLTSAALQMFHYYYVYGDPARVVPEQLATDLLTDPTLLRAPDRGVRDSMDEHHWHEIASRFVSTYPHRVVELATAVLTALGEDGSVTSYRSSAAFDILLRALQVDPKAAWKAIVECIGPPIDARAFHLTNLLRGAGRTDFDNTPGLLESVPPDLIWQWVEEDVEKRAWYLASFVPKVLSVDPGKLCLAREVLVRYGDHQDVRRNLRANFSTEGYSGPASIHLQQKIESLTTSAADETNPRVKRWIQEYIEILRQEMEEESVREERWY